MNQSKIIEAIQSAQHGDKRAYTVILYYKGSESLRKSFATGILAWAYGENWKLIDPNYNSYVMGDDREIEALTAVSKPASL